MILLYRSYIMFQMLPRRLFASESDLQYLREQLARNRVPEAGKAARCISVNRLLVYLFLFIAILAMLYSGFLIRDIIAIVRQLTRRKPHDYH
jgi:hypothetical protein